MEETSEVQALFKLIDDADKEVTEIVSNKIIGFGNKIIPNLEFLWENTICLATQNKIEGLVHKIQFSTLQQDLLKWSGSSYNDLLYGSLLVAKYQYPTLHTTPILQDLDKIKRNVWLELNNYLTPLEQANVLTCILYKYYELSGNDVSYENPNDFFINKVLESKKGNAVSIGILYQVLCDLLDINASIISIPKQILIAFYHSDYYASSETVDDRDKIHFYVDAVNGHAYSYKDIESYLKRINVKVEPHLFKPLSHKRIIQILLEEVGKCFYKKQNAQKQQEIDSLVSILA
jgi:Transglutaminase-like superfamily